MLLYIYFGGDIMLEKRMQDEINLSLSVSENVLISGNERLSLETGVMFGGEHYGFNILVENNGKSDVISHGTQCRIAGVQIVGDNLTILEDNKYIPWRFDKVTGELKNEAVFSFLKKTEQAYLRENFGIETEADLVKVNGEGSKQI
jgi:hypothetical protein